ncbi:MAG: gamma-glutamylcyclotransferase [Candidatus Stahlbacteria bacterium]|nr:MAG: gamma-glutamylcyclotransferase [Candidatus Stahlbacteria bacterium]
MSKKVLNVFVYGTLKEGRPLDRKVFADTRLSVTPATIVGSLYNLGPYPTIKLKGKGLVQGEVHKFHKDDIKEIIRTMDMIEGYNPKSEEKNNLYNRRVVTAKTKDGEKMEVYVYEYSREPKTSMKIDDGLWEPGM